jgi:hypothetical protein
MESIPCCAVFWRENAHEEVAESHCLGSGCACCDFVGGGYLLPISPLTANGDQRAADKVFALVGGYKRFNEWSPWAELDPKAVYTFEGPESGVGAKMNWASNDPNVGAGSQTITEHVPNSHVAVDLDFGTMGKSQAYWDLKPESSGTSATWGFKMKLDGMMDRGLAC